eukprot:UN32746
MKYIGYADDEISCAAFVNWECDLVGIPHYNPGVEPQKPKRFYKRIDGGGLIKVQEGDIRYDVADSPKKKNGIENSSSDEEVQIYNIDETDNENVEPNRQNSRIIRKRTKKSSKF